MSAFDDGSYCLARGYHGGWIDREKFDAAGGIWVGQGTCARCGTTRHVPTEEAKRAALAEASCANIIGKAA